MMRLFPGKRLRETEEALRQIQAELALTQAALTKAVESANETQNALRLSESVRLEAEAVVKLARDGLVRLPSILFNAVPKSAGAYINNLLMRGLVFDHFDLTLGIFPDDLLDYAKVESFRQGNKIAHHHFDASPINKRYLAMYGLRAVIHTRDPRAAILSWVHHLGRVKRPEDVPMLPMIAPPADYYGKDIAWRIDWMIEHHFSVFVRWLADWAEAEAELGALLHFTSYEDFVRDPSAVVESILDFHGIPRERFVQLDLPKTAALNFRVGRIDEWREVFDAAQQARCRARLPDALMRRFAWPE